MTFIHYVLTFLATKKNLSEVHPMQSIDDVVTAKTSNDVFILAHIMKQYKELHCCQTDQITPPKVEKSLRSIKNDWTHKVF